jgi:hypothetical protein
MEIQLIKGEFNAKDAYELLSQLLLIKIRFHENHISNDSSEEDIKYRESKIKNLQNELSNLQKALLTSEKKIVIESNILINER